MSDQQQPRIEIEQIEGSDGEPTYRVTERQAGGVRGQTRESSNLAEIEQQVRESGLPVVTNDNTVARELADGASIQSPQGAAQPSVTQTQGTGTPAQGKRRSEQDLSLG